MVKIYKAWPLKLSPKIQQFQFFNTFFFQHYGPGSTGVNVHRSDKTCAHFEKECLPFDANLTGTCLPWICKVFHQLSQKTGKRADPKSPNHLIAKEYGKTNNFLSDF